MKIRELLEGGHVFAGKTGPIKKEHIGPTLERYFAELQRLFPRKSSILNLQHFITLGSVGKKAVSGDIDLGISSKDLLDEMSDKAIASWGLDPRAVETEFLGLKKRARTATDPQLRMKAFLKVLTRFINDHSEILLYSVEKVTTGNIFGVFPQFDEKGQELGIGVQIDWMIGNLDWLRFSYYSSAYPQGSNVSGLHRTQLMLAAFQVAGLSFNHLDGVKDKATGKVIAQNPKSALDILGKRLGFKISLEDSQDYYRLHNLLKSRMRPEDYATLIDVYLKILDSTRADIPENLQGEWKKRRNRLGLTGKFLPTESNLRKAI